MARPKRPMTAVQGAPLANEPQFFDNLARMKRSDFGKLVNQVFGPLLGPALIREQVIPSLDNRTPADLLEAGVEPRDVWHHLCDTMDVPDADRWGPAGKSGVPLRSKRS